MKRYYNLDTMFRSLKDELCSFMKTRGIHYELSGCGGGWHFEILTDEHGAALDAMINELLD